MDTFPLFLEIEVRIELVYLYFAVLINSVALNY